MLGAVTRISVSRAAAAGARERLHPDDESAAAALGDQRVDVGRFDLKARVSRSAWRTQRLLGGFESDAHHEVLGRHRHLDGRHRVAPDRAAVVGAALRTQLQQASTTPHLVMPDAQARLITQPT
jgi:hypothetical protein